MKLSHFFLPHPQTHQKAHLLRVPALAVYVLLFLALQFGIKWYGSLRPDVLGIVSAVNVQELVRMTNEARVKNGLPPLSENSRLDQAAAAKARDMFAENYWAHFSPSGKDPWGFILNSGYKFSYAGENLAKNFQTSREVVDAWMNSPSHRENIVNLNYKDMGMAVAYGKINGQDTVLVVQEFGAPEGFIAQSQPSQVNKAPVSIPGTTMAPVPVQLAPAAEQVASANRSDAALFGQPALFDSFRLTRQLSLAMLTFVTILLVIDLYVLRKRAVVRITSRYSSHFALMTVAAGAILSASQGSIL